MLKFPTLTSQFSYCNMCGIYFKRQKKRQDSEKHYVHICLLTVARSINKYTVYVLHVQYTGCSCKNLRDSTSFMRTMGKVNVAMED